MRRRQSLILMFVIPVILLGCSNDSTSVNGDGKSKETTQETITEESEKSVGEKSLNDFLKIASDDNLRALIGEVSNFTQNYFQPMYKEGKSVNFLSYAEANKQLKEVVETERLQLDELQKNFDVTEYKNQDEVLKILQLQVDLIEASNDYAVATANSLNAGVEAKKYVTEASDALMRFESKSMEYMEATKGY